MAHPSGVVIVSDTRIILEKFGDSTTAGIALKWEDIERFTLHHHSNFRITNTCLVVSRLKTSNDFNDKFANAF